MIALMHTPDRRHALGSALSAGPFEQIQDDAPDSALALDADV
jgi:hypothetical protein